MSKSKEVGEGPEPDIYGNEQPILTQEQRKFLEILHSVLPALVSGPKKPLGDPSPLLVRESTSSPDKKGQEESGPVKIPRKEAQDPKPAWDKMDVFNKANEALIKTIKKFKKFEGWILSVEGGEEWMGALAHLGYCAARDIYPTFFYWPAVMMPYADASTMLIEAFEKLEGEFVEEKHVIPIRKLYRFFREKFPNLHRTSTVTDQTMFEILPSFIEHIDDVNRSLSELVDSVIPGTLKAQETVQSIKYNNMLTTATFFSAVTATTLQLSYTFNASTRETLGITVNTLWFVALVFSTASSLNSLVGLTWYQKTQRIRLLPNWARLYLENGPTISLAVASAAFSIGLCLFAFSSTQHTITSVLTATFTATHAVALFVPLCLYSPKSLSRFEAFCEYLLTICGYPLAICGYIYGFFKGIYEGFMCIYFLCVCLDQMQHERDIEAQPDFDENMSALERDVKENAPSAEKPGRAVKRVDALPPLESEKGPSAAESSTTDLILGLGLSPLIENSERGPENGASQAANTYERLSTSLEEKPDLPVDFFVQDVGAYNVDASSPTSDVGHGREEIVDETRDTAFIRSPGNLK